MLSVADFRRFKAAGGWWLVAGGWWLVAGDWWLLVVAGSWWWLVVAIRGWYLSNCNFFCVRLGIKLFLVFPIAFMAGGR
jgi:hypothetical protein